MPVNVVSHYTRSMLRSNPTTLFVFGDNMKRSGFGGQAKECRGEPNAVGIPTKWAPSHVEAAYFNDSDLQEVQKEIDKAFERLERHLKIGGVVVVPSSGIGTGLAQLPSRAPKIFDYITNKLQDLYMI